MNAWLLPLRCSPAGKPCGAVAALALLAVCGSSGCERRPPPSRFDVLTGTVAGLRADTGELTVRTGLERPDGIDDQNVTCLITSDAEVYINDKFSSIAEIDIGDDVQLIGYVDPDPRTERFLVSLARISRSAALPPPPDLPIPTSQPATPSQEK